MQNRGITLRNSVDLDELVDGYTQSLTTTVDKHAPQKTHLINLRPHAPSYTNEIADAKKQCCQAEHCWCRTKDSDDRLAYIKACKSVNSLIYHTKSSHYTTVVFENKGNQNVLLTTVNKLLHRNSGKVLPCLHLISTWQNSLLNSLPTKFLLSTKA